jgi:hypothetical protein
MGPPIFQRLRAKYNNGSSDEGESDYSDGDSDSGTLSPKHPSNITGVRVAINPPSYLNFDQIRVAQSQVLKPSDKELTASKQAWQKIWRKKQHRGLANEVMKHEIAGRYMGSAAIHGRDNQWAGDAMTKVLQSSEDCLIESVAFGSLAWDRRQDQRLDKVLRRLWQWSDAQPGCYSQQLVDGSGQSPSPKILAKAIQHMRDYAKGINHAHTTNLKATV